MSDFTLTWATTNNRETCFIDEQPICTYSGNREAIFHLHYLLVRELDKKFVTVRDRLGNVVDMSKGMLEMPMYGESCLLDPKLLKDVVS